MMFNLNYLTNPSNSIKPLNLFNIKRDTLFHLLFLMFKIRETENKIALSRKAGQIGGPVHLSVGQEAIAAGISVHLTKNDRVFGNHRSHSHFVALGGDIRKLFSEILGKSTGCSKGNGGSMHLIDDGIGFYGSAPIVAGTVSLAVGAALALKMNKSNGIVVSYLGDGAIEEGIVHESLNLASIYKLPILFVVENNLFASHMHISQRQSSSSTARFAVANNIPHSIIDGNDISSVFKKSRYFIRRCRNNEGPFFIEAFTYRHLGHVDWREDEDVGINRSRKDLNLWKLRDPIGRLEEALIKLNFIDLKTIKSEKKKILDYLNLSWEKSIKDPYPDDAQLLNYVYSQKIK